MNADREYFYELVNNIPEERLPELRMTLLRMAIPEETPTEEELEAIKRGKQQIENGEFVVYKSFSDMERDIMND